METARSIVEVIGRNNKGITNEKSILNCIKNKQKSYAHAQKGNFVIIKNEKRMEDI
jgi:hypothetical protein